MHCAARIVGVIVCGHRCAVDYIICHHLVRYHCCRPLSLHCHCSRHAALHHAACNPVQLLHIIEKPFRKLTLWIVSLIYNFLNITDWQTLYLWSVKSFIKIKRILMWIYLFWSYIFEPICLCWRWQSRISIRCSVGCGRGPEGNNLIITENIVQRLIIQTTSYPYKIKCSNVWY